MGNALTITQSYPKEKFNLLVSMDTVAEIAAVHKPVMNVVTISTNPNDKEIYVQQKAYNDSPNLYAITKKGLNKLMRAAGIKIISSRPINPSTCEKCAQINQSIGQPVSCGACGNKDVAYEVVIEVPQLTGENIQFVAHKEISIAEVTAGMTERQKAEFMKFRSEICETKAINRALRAAMQIKGTYTLDELKKPFVVAYLVPNLDNPDVRTEAVKSMFKASNDLYGSRTRQNRVELSDDIEEGNDTTGAETFATEPPSLPQSVPEYQLPPEPDYTPPEEYYQTPDEYTTPPKPAASQSSYIGAVCEWCGERISEKVQYYSKQHFGRALCMKCQKQAQVERR